MSSSSEQVWAWLVRATLWPTWYVNASRVRILQGNGSDLALGTKFRWTTFRVMLVSIKPIRSNQLMFTRF